MFILVIIAASSVVSASSSTFQESTYEESGAPVLELIGDKSVGESNLLTFEISATDPDKDNIDYFSPNLPEGASLDNISGVFEWIPEYNQSGVHYVQFIANDGKHNDSEYVTITVLNTNRPPVLSVITDSNVEENNLLEITLEASDPDGDVLGFTKDVSFGTISGNKFSWTPSYDDSGDYSINFAVNDGDTEVVQNAKISVNNVNRPPVLYSISDRTVMENEPVNIQLFGFDPDGANLIFSNVSNLPDGAVFDNVIGIIQWTPSDMDTGENYIDFVVSDGLSFSNEKRTRIMVGTSQSPPIFNSISSKSVDENSILSFDVIANDTDGDHLIYSMITYPDGATFESTSGTFEWTPSYEQEGTHIVEFVVFDDSKYSFKSYVTTIIEVNDVNRAPAIGFVKNYVLHEKEPLIITLSVSDADGDSLSLSTNVSFGNIRGNTFIWTPGYSDSDIYHIQFSVSDGDLSANTSATLYVEETNMPPEFDPIGSKTVYENDTLDFTVSAYDGDNDTLSLSASGLPREATFNNSNGQFTWIPNASQDGLHTVSFQVTDGELFDYETISITVKEPSDSSTETSSGSSSSGRGGGGSQSTGEAYENIDFKDYVLKSVVKDIETVFNFSKEENSIISVSFTTSLNGGQTKAVVEILKDTSTLVSRAPSGTVYKNMNIWVGDGKFLPSLISDANVVFKVEKSWIESRGVDPDSIKLLRYSGSEWKQLSTSRTGENEEYFYYVADTPGFSPFAISSVKEEAAMAEASGEETESTSNNKDIKNSVEDGTTSESNIAVQEDKSIGTALFMLIALGSVFIGLFRYNNKEYCDECYEKIRVRFGNPDGKRYRRFKR